MPLARFDGPADPILEECRERIERDAPARERDDLRVVTQFFAGLKYNDPRLFEKLGGDEEMLKTGSPLLRKIIEEETDKARRESERGNIITCPRGPLRAGGRGVEGRDLKAIGDARFKGLLGLAATRPDLASFRAHLPSRKRQRRS